MADYSKLTKRELIMTLYARDLMLENERNRLEEYKQSLKKTIDHYENYISELNHQSVMVYAAARNYEDKCKLLQDQLALTEKALELACKEIDKIVVFDAEFLESDSFYAYYLKKAEEIMKSETTK
jgi:outer membrane protein TolC